MANKLLTLAEASELFWNGVYKGIEEYEKRYNVKVRTLQFNPKGLDSLDGWYLNVITDKMAGAVGNDPTSSASKADSPASERPGRERCGLCDGLGIVADPHHGHAFTCERCRGVGFTTEKT